jgi:hypothetical protein
MLAGVHALRNAALLAAGVDGPDFELDGRVINLQSVDLGRRDEPNGKRL